MVPSHIDALIFLLRNGQGKNVRHVTLGGIGPAELLKRLSGPGREPQILGEIICAMYWGGRVDLDLQQVELLSRQNWELAIEIMGYRRSQHWSEPQFHVIALWCREEFALSQWDSEE